MLDQNTDRMWFVIGAVIVGAAIIFIANGTIPDIFASVAESFKDSSDQATNVVSEIYPNTGVTMILNEHVRISDYPTGAEFLGYDEDGSTWRIDVKHSPLGWSGGASIREEVVEVPFGYKSTVSYEVWSPVDTYAGNDINNIPVVGEQWGTKDDSTLTSTNDNDTLELRENVTLLADLQEGNFDPVNFIPANTWTTVSFTWYNTSEWNEDKVSLYEYSTFGAYNPNPNERLTIKIKNAQVRVSEAQ